jgi:hypothetical protein
MSDVSNRRQIARARIDSGEKGREKNGILNFPTVFGVHASCFSYDGIKNAP